MLADARVICSDDGTRSSVASSACWVFVRICKDLLASICSDDGRSVRVHLFRRWNSDPLVRCYADHTFVIRLSSAAVTLLARMLADGTPTRSPRRRVHLLRRRNRCATLRFGSALSCRLLSAFVASFASLFEKARRHVTREKTRATRVHTGDESRSQLVTFN